MGFPHKIKEVGLKDGVEVTIMNFWDSWECMQKQTPKLFKLDGAKLAALTKGGSKGDALPPCKNDKVLPPAIKKLILKFLKLYYAVFDWEDRDLLHMAYHEDARFTLLQYKSKKKDGMLEIGRLNVVGLLHQLPRTQHDLRSLKIRLMEYTETSLSFTVSGLFMEMDGKLAGLIRAFDRLFRTVPVIAGIQIITDELNVKKAMSQEIGTTFVTSDPNLSLLSEVRKRQVIAFSRHSRMKVEWALKCLQENGWNLDLACNAFMSLKAQGFIPPQAFKKVKTTAKGDS